MHYRIQILFLLITYSLFSTAYLKAGNVPQGEAQFPNKVVFSQPSGFYEKEFKLSLSHPDSNVKIYYTLDGSEPDPNNLKGSTYRYKNNYEQPPNKPKDNFLYHRYKTYQYTQPILIKDRSHDPDRISQISTTTDKWPFYFPISNKLDSTIFYINRVFEQINTLGNRLVRKYYKISTGEIKLLHTKEFIPLITYKSPAYSYKGTPVRAIAVNELGIKSPIATHTFFIGSQESFDLPIIVLTVPEKDLFDYDEGIFVAGHDYDNWLASSPENLGTEARIPANWHKKGKLINRKKASLEQINQGQSSAVLSIELKIHGNGSRADSDKKFRIYLKKWQSLDSFVTERGNLKGLRFNFRIGNKATNFIADTAAERIAQGLSFSTQNSYGYRNIFLNGEYYGIRNIRDVKDTHYLSYFYHLPHRKKIKLLFNKFNNEIPTNKDLPSLLKGDFQEWRKINQAFDQQENQSINFAQKYIDIDSFIDYYIAEIFLANKDYWPQNNYAFWKYLGKYNEDNPASDGRYRWLLYDLDAALQEVNYESLKVAAIANPTQDPFTFIFSTLLKNPEFKERFITRFSDLMNTTFVPERTISIIENTKQEVEKELPRHIQRWKYPLSIEAWQDNINTMVNFARDRPAIQYQQLQSFFELSGTYQLKIDVNDSDFGALKVNTLHLGLKDNELTKPVAASCPAVLMDKVLAFPWQGKYFKNLSLKLEAIPKSGYVFSHWQGAGLTDEQTIHPILELQPEADIKLIAVFERVS
ncbi:CotH kinase family protein [Candidatus Nitrosacidococcus tergens]|uniref:Putative Spore coat protein CotH n=1 Tax=Candidatus Nitrosacidococcus tergens TaxID=553981 RepID=A0A7G1Q8X3_9GAMM|nr:CotH kinase family protein [Candidatus Nitrosacidococcus tergens]CAB1275347.1 putative Spore coat protein CotH [Candidatus Nitrosacidococcus tergens]